jgi:hypothetical protein
MVMVVLPTATSVLFMIMAMIMAMLIPVRMPTQVSMYMAVVASLVMMVMVISMLALISLLHFFALLLSSATPSALHLLLPDHLVYHSFLSVSRHLVSHYELHGLLTNKAIHLLALLF